jgi:hypothetical protein
VFCFVDVSVARVVVERIEIKGARSGGGNQDWRNAVEGGGKSGAILTGEPVEVWGQVRESEVENFFEIGEENSYLVAERGSRLRTGIKKKAWL